MSDQNKVTISYRSDVFSRIKVKNREKITEASNSGLVKVLFNTSPKSINKSSVTLTKTSGEELEIKNDLVYIFAGGELPTQFLQKAGIHITKKFGEAILKHEN